MRTPSQIVCLVVICLSLAQAAMADDYLAAAAPSEQPSSYYDEPTSGEQPVSDDLAASGDPCAPCFDPCACSACQCCCDGLQGPRLLGFLPSDHCFDRFISPLSNPFFFEDPRSLTEIRGVFIDNSLPRSTGGGDLQVYAGQLRGRISENLSVIAPRLGNIQVNQAGGGNPVGFLSAPVGLKYNFFRDVDRQRLLSAGLTYFIPGASSAFSNFGQGDFHIFLTGGTQIFDRGHWLSGSGFRIPSNSNFGTQLWYWSNQWDYEVVDHWYGLFGLNWYHWMKNAGNNFTNGIGGLDLLNLPTAGVAGTNVVTAVVGGRWKPSGHLEMGTGFEFPLSSNTDILHNRVYADVIFRY